MNWAVELKVICPVTRAESRLWVDWSLSNNVTPIPAVVWSSPSPVTVNDLAAETNLTAVPEAAVTVDGIVSEIVISVPLILVT